MRSALRFACRSADGRLKRVELAALVSEEAGEDLFDGSFAVGEPDAARRRDRVELGVGELGDARERNARGPELFG